MTLTPHHPSWRPLSPCINHALPYRLPRKIWKTAIIGLMACAHWQAFAQTPIFTLPESVVTATRQPQRINATIADISVIDAQTLQTNGSSLLSTLRQQAGISTKADGGLSGTSSVFLRNHDSDQTLFLIDGFRLSSVNLGSINWQLLSGTLFDRAEILRGASSSLYGADAVGGVVQLFTRSPQNAQQPTRLDAEIGMGSWARKVANATLSGGSAEFSYLLSGLTDSADGFSATNNQSTYNYNDDRDGYRKSGGVVNLSFRPQGNDDHQISLTALSISGWNDYDSGKTDAWQRWAENRLIGVRDQFRLGNWQSTIRLGSTKDLSQEYKNGKPNSQFDTTQEQWQWQNDINLSQGSLLLSTEYLRQKIDTSQNFPTKSRTIHSVQVGYSLDFAEHAVQTNLRYDHNSQFGAHTTGSFGYGYRLTRQWRWNISTGSSFRAPLFGELYYPNYSNAHLQPEKGRNIETGIHFDSTTSAFSAIVFQDQIRQAISSDSATNWIPYNIGSARIRGLNLRYQQMIESWDWQINFDHIRALDRQTGKLLTYRPIDQIKANLRYNFADRTQISVGGYGATKHYTDKNNSENKASQPFAIFDVQVSQPLSPDWSIEARINNLFDKNYVTDPGYNNPRRHFFLTVRYHGA